MSYHPNEADASLFQQLSALGAGDFVHLNGTLESHFGGVYCLLRSWDADDTLCRAGLYHAAYGTAGFTSEMVSLDRRAEVRRLIGTDAESIVYEYCACDRISVWPQIGVSKNVTFHDRFSGEARPLDETSLRCFCELTCANEIEIALNDQGFVSIHGADLLRLFSQWDGFLSSSARDAVKATFISSD